MSPAAAAAPKKRLGVGGGGFALGCGCKDAKAVAVAAAASASPYSGTTATTTEASSTATTTEASSTATTATWRRVTRAAAAASGSTGTLTVPSASSSTFFPWEDVEVVDGDGEEEEVDCGKRASTSSFSGLLRQLNELEQSVVSWERKGTGSKSYLSPPPPPPPPPPLPSRPVATKQRAAAHRGDRRDSKEEGHGNFSPPSFQFQTHQHRKAKSMDKGDSRQDSRQPPPQSIPLQPEQPPNTKKSADKIIKKEDVLKDSPVSQPQAAKHRKAKSLDGGRLVVDGTVAVVKQSADPLSDFRRSMVNMIVENRIATGDELRDLLRHFLALNAPHHHDAILRAFTEIWDEAFSATTKQVQHRESSVRPTPPKQRAVTPPRQTATPQRRRHPTARVWR